VELPGCQGPSAIARALPDCGCGGGGAATTNHGRSSHHPRNFQPATAPSRRQATANKSNGSRKVKGPASRWKGPGLDNAISWQLSDLVLPIKQARTAAANFTLLFGLVAKAVFAKRTGPSARSFWKTPIPGRNFASSDAEGACVITSLALFSLEIFFTEYASFASCSCNQQYRTRKRVQHPFGERTACKRWYPFATQSEPNRSLRSADSTEAKSTPSVFHSLIVSLSPLLSAQSPAPRLWLCIRQPATVATCGNPPCLACSARVSASSYCPAVCILSRRVRDRSL